MSAITSDLSSTAAQVGQLQQLAQNGKGVHRGHHRHGGGEQFKAAFSQAAQDAGLDPSKTDDLQKQIDAAIENARKNNTGSGDSRQSIQDAVDGVLKQNGVDVSKFHDALKARLQAARAQHQSQGAVRGNDADDAAPVVSSLTPGSVDTVG